MCNRTSSWFCDKILKESSVLSSSCVSFCSGHQKLCVPDVELPRVRVQEPEHEAGAPSCQHICFRTDHKSPNSLPKVARCLFGDLRPGQKNSPRALTSGAGHARSIEIDRDVDASANFERP